MKPLVFVVDDDPAIVNLALRHLGVAGYGTDSCPSGEALFEGLEHDDPSAVLLDVDLPGMNGIETLGHIRKRRPDLPVIMLTADDNVETVVQSMKLGAYDYVTKPIDAPRLLSTVARAVERHSLTSRVSQLERHAAGGYAGIVGVSSRMRSVFERMERLMHSDITVLVHGESGTGKELIARALHRGGERSSGPFVAVNSAAIPESLVESELFGHERGAFTGAVERRIGRFEQANGGVIFLDEIGELSSAMQARLLRVLQERSFQRVGGSQTIQSDFRLISATHRNLAAEVEAGRFREDLYFRLAVFELEVPPLRHRAEDIPLLVSHFLAQYSGGKQISEAAMRILVSYSWPGNVRELQNVIQRALVLADDVFIRPQDLPEKVLAAKAEAHSDEDEDSATLENASRRLLLQALARHGGNASAAMRELNIGRARFYRMIRRFGIAQKVDEMRQAGPAA